MFNRCLEHTTDTSVSVVHSREMDFFDSPYYSLNRKLLVLIGQWPYENQTARIKRHIFVALVMISVATVQFAKLFSANNPVNTVVELMSMQFINVICIIKYWTNDYKREELKMLLENMRMQWASYTSEHDHKILHKFAEMGRKYSLFCAMYFYIAIIVCLTGMASQPLLVKIFQLNMTMVLICPAEYFVDQNKYFYPIFLHMSLATFVLATIIIASDTLLILFLYHACGMYETVSCRIEAAFDKCERIQEWKQGEMILICKRIADAVHYHRSTVEFRDSIMSIFGFMLMLIAIPLALNLTMVLYITATYLDEFNHIVTSIMIAMCHVVHAMVVVIPCQKIVDYSKAIAFRAYCSQWYMVPARLQTLVLPIIQRCTKPDTLVAGKMLPFTMECYAAGVQSSLSYFMVMLSLR